METGGKREKKKYGEGEFVIYVLLIMDLPILYIKVRDLNILHHIRYLQLHDNQEKQKTSAVGSNEAHHAASLGVISRLIKIAEEDPDALTKKDENGWMPIHEAVRGGHFEIVKYLVDKGSNFNERTNKGTGGTPLWWALTSLDEDHRVIKYLKELGAINLGPEL